MNTTELAQLHSATSFLNSFLLEWDQSVLNENKKRVIISINESEFVAGVKTFSFIGRHQYDGHFEIIKSNNSQVVTFELFAEELISSLSKHFDYSKEAIDQFSLRLQNSISTVEATLKLRFEELKNLSVDSLNFQSAEQAMFIGHTFHPTPKSRGEFSKSDLSTYSPELRGQFPLEWIIVHESLVSERHSSSFKDSEWLKNIFAQENKNKIIPSGFTPFPVHPWQKKFILQNSAIQEYLNQELLFFTGEGDKSWIPTSSLRTLYTEHSDYMLKFSLNVKLTNSLRTLLVHELERGLQVHEVMTHQNAKDFHLSNPYFSVIYEPVYAGIKDKNGALISETLIVGRINPFKDKTHAIVLSTLTQDDISFENNLIQKEISQLTKKNHQTLKDNSIQWFKSFLQVGIAPILDAQANYGILLGSHQQNMVIELSEHLPVKSYFRDCNGTGYSKLGHELFSSISRITMENGNILEEEVASYLFGYYVIINSTFNTISAIAQSHEITEIELIKMFRQTLIDIKETNPKDSSFLDYLLESESLMHKGNFFCSIKNLNENTEKNPLSIYTKISNPIFKVKTL